ncbi:MAG: rRNA-processing protein las1 [Piccolia ochrophora]|nr:MAG: rRNA-processing protein las1 [Piccolia ochrophora]
MASAYEITPWRTPHELRSVRAQLFPPFHAPLPAERRAALDHIRAWRARGRLPPAIEATALLVDAILHDEAGAGREVSVWTVEKNYCTALTRFVTTHADPPSRFLPSSQRTMFATARNIGLPAAFVDLRHEITHGSVPPLGVLRASAREAVAWLERGWWRGVDSEDADSDDGEGEEEGEKDGEQEGENVMDGDDEWRKWCEEDERREKEEENDHEDEDGKEGGWYKPRGVWRPRPIGVL